MNVHFQNSESTEYRESDVRQMGKRKNQLIANIHAWIAAHPLIFASITLVLGAILGWLVTWVLPSPPVIASNMPQKELTCTLNYSQELIQKRTTDNKLQITYDGKEADDPYLFNISIQNTGSLAISNDDFKKDFVVEFHDCEGILNAQISKSSSQYVTEEILSNAIIDGENIIISDFFINPGESFTISVITNKAPSGINYNARISDISSLVLRNTPREKRESLHNTMITFLIIVIVAFAAFAVVETISYKRFKKRLESELKNSYTISS